MILLKSEDEEGDANDTKKSTKTSKQFIVMELKVFLSLMHLMFLKGSEDFFNFSAVSIFFFYGLLRSSYTTHVSSCET